MNPIKLFLFDLDGTLVSTGGAGLRALGRAFEDCTGVKDAVRAVSPAGKTDPAIFREMVRVHLSRDMRPDELRKISQTYLHYLAIEINAALKITTLPGVARFLDYLMTRGDVMMGLGTGNLETGARMKLKRPDLNTYFPFGGFGSDAEERPEVLRCGHRRAEERCGETIAPHLVFIIGDTPLDVRAARTAGYRSVAVAGGGATLSQLQESQPDYLLKDMNDGFNFIQQLDRATASLAL